VKLDSCSSKERLKDLSEVQPKSKNFSLTDIQLEEHRLPQLAFSFRSLESQLLGILQQSIGLNLRVKYFNFPKQEHLLFRYFQVSL